ncbi:Protein-L-isoaspartate O-methyltransferase 2, partial [Clarias magur]
GHLSNAELNPASTGKRRTEKNIRRRGLSDCQRLLTVLWTGLLHKHLSVETVCFHQGFGPQERVETGHLIGPSGPQCSVPDCCPSATISSPHINQSCFWG